MNPFAIFWSARKCFFVAVALTRLWYAGAVAEEPDKVLFQQHLPRVPAYVMSEATLAGKPCIMILDTGAGNATLDNSLKDSIRTEIGQANVLTADGGTHPMMLYEGPTLKLGQLSVERPTVLLSDLRMYSLYTGRPVSGILGMKVLDAGKIFLNYDQDVFQVHVGPWKLDKADCHEVELEKELDATAFKTDILGHEARFTVDTGYNACVDLEAKIFNALVKEGSIEPAKMDARALSLGGMSSATQGWFLKGKLMGKNLAGVSVSSNPTDSILGVEWLYGFNTEIDFAKRKLRYQLRSEAKLPGSVHVMLGAILLYDANGAQIERLRPSGGAVEDAGLKPGDVIEKFANLKAAEMNAVTVGEAIADAADKEVAVRVLRKADGEQVNTILKLPPNISEWNFSGRDIMKGK